MRLDAATLRARLTGLAAVAVLALAGCGGDDTKTVTVTPGGAGASATSEAPADTGGTAPRDEAVNTDDALAKKTVRALDSRDGTVEIAILGLKVEDRLMRLTMAFTPKFPSESPDDEISLYDMHGQTPLYVTLVDPVNLKRYVVVKDSEGRELAADAVATGTPNGGTVMATWTFAAAPQNVAKLDVQVGEWPPFSDVEIQR